MSGTINKVILIGNLGKDPEVRYLDNKRVVANFSIATHEVYIDTNTQQKKKHVDWHPIVCWNQNAEFVDKYCKKGMKVYVEGKLRLNHRKDENNYTVYQNEILADKIQIISYPISEETTKKSPYPKDESIKPTPISNHELLNLDDDEILPF